MLRIKPRCASLAPDGLQSFPCSARLTPPARHPDPGLRASLAAQTASVAPASGLAGFDPHAVGPASTAAQPANPATVQNLQDQKEALQKAGTTETRNSGNLQMPASPYQVVPGTVIAAALVTSVKSDLSGNVISTVTAPVYDTATGRYLLIPQGSRILGKYNKPGRLRAEPRADRVEPHHPAGRLRSRSTTWSVPIRPAMPARRMASIGIGDASWRVVQHCPPCWAWVPSWLPPIRETSIAIPSSRYRTARRTRPIKSARSSRTATSTSSRR